MLKDANIGKGIIVTVGNKIGVLAHMSQILANHGINIDAIVGYTDIEEARIMLVTNDNARAIDVLKKEGYRSAIETEVIMVKLENNPGALESITTKLASAGIDIKYIYGTTCPTGCPARLVLSTSDDEKALLAFKNI
jgi:hypothetical protein